MLSDIRKMNQRLKTKGTDGSLLSWKRAGLFLLLALGTLLFCGPVAAEGETEALLSSINGTLADISFTAEEGGGAYSTAWQNSYQLALSGKVLTIFFSEDATSYKGQKLQDRYSESGTYSIDLRKTEGALVTVSENGEQLRIACRDGASCIGQSYAGTLYDKNNVVKTSREGDKWFASVTLNVSPALLSSVLLSDVRLLIDGAGAGN